MMVQDPVEIEILSEIQLGVLIEILVQTAGPSARTVVVKTRPGHPHLLMGAVCGELGIVARPVDPEIGIRHNGNITACPLVLRRHDLAPVLGHILDQCPHIETEVLSICQPLASGPDQPFIRPEIRIREIAYIPYRTVDQISVEHTARSEPYPVHGMQVVTVSSLHFLRERSCVQQ